MSFPCGVSSPALVLGTRARDHQHPVSTQQPFNGRCDIVDPREPCLYSTVQHGYPAICLARLSCVLHERQMRSGRDGSDQIRSDQAWPSVARRVPSTRGLWSAGSRVHGPGPAQTGLMFAHGGGPWHLRCFVASARTRLRRPCLGFCILGDVSLGGRRCKLDI